MKENAEEHVKVNAEAKTALAKKLSDQFLTWSNDRRDIEKQWLRSQRQYNGEYDPEVLQRMNANQSRAYPRITRVKVVSMVARLMALLFPAGERNWSVNASPKPELGAEAMKSALQMWAADNPNAPFNLAEFDRVVASYAQKSAKRTEDALADQLADLGEHGPAGYQTLVRQVVYSAVKYGVGLMKGPSTMVTTKVVGTVINNQPVVNEQQTYRPFFDYVDCFNYYPDLAAKTFEQMDGEYERHVLSRHQLLQLAKRNDFDGEAIRKYVSSHPDGNYTRKTFETEVATSSNATNTAIKGKKYELLEYWGYISGNDLRNAGVTIPDEKLAMELSAVMWILDDVVVKAAENPLPEGAAMYHKFVFEEDDVNLMGNGLPVIVRDSQMGIASASRMLIDNASVVCGPNVEVDYNRLMAGQDTTLTPFKVWMIDSTSAPTGGRAVSNVSFDSHIPELLQVINTFMEFADKESFVNPMTGGDMENAPSEPLRTSSGMSMVMGNAALPFRDVVRNFDRFTVSILHSLIEWNRIFNPAAVVLSDVRPIGRGATSLVAKEVRALALDQLATTLLDEERDHIDMRELAKQRLIVRDLPHESLMVSEEDANKTIADKQAKQERIEDQQYRLGEATIKDTNADAVKSAAQAQKNLTAADATVFTQALNAIDKGVEPYVVASAARRANSTAIVPQIGAEPTADVGAAGGGLPQVAGQDSFAG